MKALWESLVDLQKAMSSKVCAGFASDVIEAPANGITPINYAMKVPNAAIQ